MARVIVFASGKGGVGKTTIAGNVGAALHEAGKRVILVDANVTTPNLGLHFGITNTPKTLHDVLNDEASISEAVYKHDSGLKIVPSGLSFSNLNRRIKKKLSYAISRIVGDADYILVDSSAGLGKEAKLALKTADELVIVTNPDLPSITDALKMRKLGEKYRVNVLGVVINKYSGFDFDLAVDNIQDFLDVPVLGIVPHDINVKRALSNRKPVFHHSPQSKSRKAIEEIVNNITEEELYADDRSDRGFISFLKKMLGLQ